MEAVVQLMRMMQCGTIVSGELTKQNESRETGALNI